MSRNRARNVVRNTDIVSKALRTLKGTTGLAWRKIALLDDYSPIPAGTLCAIAKGYPVPKRWRQRLGLPLLAPAPVCLKCGQVHVTKRRTKGTRRITRWRDLEPEQLRWALENRYEL